MDNDLIQLVNKLQDTFANLGGELDMPQIVVVGSQSAGKSSVLETIVGRDFLPRGAGIVTRRPLTLQLVHIPPPDPDNPTASSYAEYGQFLHLDKRFTDFGEIRREIEAETFRVAGQNKGISKLPISLRIYSPKVLDLTLVDLPGLTKIPVGDQPSDIERQIRNLVLEYISKPNAVILAVSAANVDLANSDALKLARSVDPQGRRTIGVLTKLDLMDAGTNALDILNGRIYPLKLGFIGVVNRSQQDINSERSMDDAQAHEKEFFQNHPAYRSISHRNGTRYLAKTLNHVLLNHIREKLPDMKARLNTLMGQTQHELDSFGDAALFDGQHQGALVLKLMTSFARDFVSSIEGTSSDISTKELSGGARIYYIFNDVFGHALESIDSTSNLTTQDIRTAIRNSTGPRPSLFVPEVAFDLLVKPQIKLLEGPSLRCVELVYEELVKICHNCTSTELQRFPRLHARLIDVISELLQERLGPTSEYASSLIDIQAAYINTNHPAFMQNSAHAHAHHQRRTAAVPPPITSTDMNGSVSAEEEEADDEHSEVMPNGTAPKDTRSVSSTVHDRSRAPSFVPSGAKEAPPMHNMARHDRRSTSGGAQLGVPTVNAGTSPASAKETFLNYFFGGNQPGMPPGASPAALMVPRHSQVGRDLNPESGVPSSALQAVRTLDGSNAAFDMKSLGKHIEAVSAAPLSVREEMECSLIRSLIASYFDIVRQTIQDLIPKSIMHLLVNHTSQQVQNRLVSSLYKPELFADLLHEDEALVNERARVKALLDAYKEAFRTLSEVSLKPL
ncbi:hypothetical protein DACRYDRAFT_49126 [Dacryopinax primogenitus]|uniref:Dynamin protein dnm1 n=1 Tax=Dacryopinax primogenitus (strain DJM 731) TaxID=1858805 RepID=M5GF29_DACPD|nr:uncharacterized protein DACRYDRAFT_49126 [Dacryopinax primogenitus]EJU03783.1 hypothetical protein DACRYDRAFT_49126 [Dacryopinax primogenitus]